MILLMLDCDGVVHPLVCYSNCFRKENIDPLWQAIKEHDIKIVITSSWRYRRSLDWLKEILGPLGERVIGQTPLSADVPEQYRRQNEVEQYLEQFSEPTKWIAVDDICFNYKPGTLLIVTDEKMGFTKQDGERLEALIIQLENNEAITIDSEYGKTYFVPNSRLNREYHQWYRKVKAGAEVYRTHAGKNPTRVHFTSPAEYHAWLDELEKQSGIIARFSQLLKANGPEKNK